MPRLANMVPRIANLVVSLVGASPAACLAPSLPKRLSQHALASLPRLQNHAMSRRLLRSSWSAEHAQAMRQLPLVIPKMLARRPMIAEHHPTTFSPASSIMANSMIVSQLQLAFRQRVLSAMPRLANMVPRTANLVVSLVGASPAACLAPSLPKRLSQHALASLPRLQNHAMSSL